MRRFFRNTMCNNGIIFDRLTKKKNIYTHIYIMGVSHSNRQIRSCPLEGEGKIINLCSEIYF